MILLGWYQYPTGYVSLIHTLKETNKNKKNVLLLSSAPCESNVYLSNRIVQLGYIQMLYEWFDDNEIPEIETDTSIDPERQFSKSLSWEYALACQILPCTVSQI